MDSELLTLAAMGYCHIVDDYYLQGWLANGKSKYWWIHTQQSKFEYNRIKHDYKAALIEHAFSWAFSISIPLFAYCFIFDMSYAPVLIALPINAAIHAVIDNAKANLAKINLVQDQAAHIAQIIFTWLAVIC